MTLSIAEAKAEAERLIGEIIKEEGLPQPEDMTLWDKQMTVTKVVKHLKEHFNFDVYTPDGRMVFMGFEEDQNRVLRPMAQPFMPGGFQ